MTTRRLVRGASHRLLAAMAPLWLAVFVLGTGVAVAAIEPSAIALNPEDLPPGFTIDASRTSDREVGNIGPGHLRALNREFTPANLSDGPVWIVQSVVRLDSGIGAGDALRLQRDYWESTAGYTPTSDGPNDGGTTGFQDGSPARALSGFTAQSAKGVQSTRELQLLFYVPAVGSDEPIRLLGWSESLVNASEVP